MIDRTGIFAGDDPFVLAQRWLDEASKTEPSDPNAMALATVDEHGLPDVRVVLLKAIETDRFVFFTNYSSRKGRQIAQSGLAAFNIHWKTLGRQIRVRGEIAKVSPEVSDAYYQSRPLGSRIGAWASNQSAPLNNRDELVAAVDDAAATHGDAPARPSHWGGYYITPLELEFWCNGEDRLHDRFRWTRQVDKKEWKINRLNP